MRPDKITLADGKYQYSVCSQPESCSLVATTFWVVSVLDNVTEARSVMEGGEGGGNVLCENVLELGTAVILRAQSWLTGHLSVSGVQSFIIRAGYGGHLESFFPFKAGSGSLSSVISPQAGREGGRVRCRLRMTGEEGRSIMQTCTECLNTRSDTPTWYIQTSVQGWDEMFRLVNVSNAWYADCNGLYTITNLSSVWDPKRLVYQRIKGGINPEDNRWLLYPL